MCSRSVARGVRSMRVTWCVALPTVALVLFAGSLTAAQRPYPVFTEYHLDRTMTLVGRNFAGANRSLANRDFEAAKARLTRAREQLAVSVTFWRHKGTDDAVGMLRDTLAKLDALDAALSAETVDAIAASALSKQAEMACETCHAVYREPDPDSDGYRLRPGSV